MNRYVIAAMITTLVIVNVILYYTIVKSEEVIDPTEQSKDNYKIQNQNNQ